MNEAPFRWDITRRSQLGGLVEGVALPTYAGFIDGLQQCGARDWAVRRWRPLFHRTFAREPVRSPKRAAVRLIMDPSIVVGAILGGGVGVRPPVAAAALTAFRAYCHTIGLAPEQIIHRPRPVTFVDLVSSGHTFKYLVGLLQTWCGESGYEWPAVRRKLRIVGITWRTKTSPKTVRWQQQADWVGILERGAIKNVSVPGQLWSYLGNIQPKVTPSYPHWRWGLPGTTTAPEANRNPEALRLALHLFDEGRARNQRYAFARHLARDRAMIHPWYRDLVRELKR